ncbi:MAG: TlpA family protein disulfide reductase, partial [Solirubrobacteraceae bacterium]
MRRSTVPILLGVVIVALIGLLAYAMGRSAPGEETRDTIDAQVQAGKVVPAPGADRPMPRLGAEGTQRLADLRGQVVILNVWGSWCIPCEAEVPLLQKVHERLQKAKVGTVWGVTNRDDPEKSLAFVRKHGMTYPSVRDPDSALALEYGALRVPETVIIDARGRIRGIYRGEITEEFLDASLRRAGV